MKTLSHMLLIICALVVGCVHTAPDLHTGTGLPSDRYDYLWNACIFWIGSKEQASVKDKEGEQKISKILFDVWLHPEHYKFRTLPESMSTNGRILEIQRRNHESRLHDFTHVFANEDRLPATYRLEVAKAASTLEKEIHNHARTQPPVAFGSGGW